MPAPAAKARADQAVVAAGLAESRSEAQALIRSGRILADDQPVTKPGSQISAAATLRLKGPRNPWASRGADKLLAALDQFELSPTGRTALDIGASTGGFTDVLLARGAGRVYAVDSGTNQLAWRLRQDGRVAALENTNARYLAAEQVPEPVGAITCDASFISLKTVLPAALALAEPGAWLVALIKPQFEAGRDQVGKGGVVRDQAVRDAVVAGIRTWLAEEMGWAVLGETESPVTGPAGNTEYLIAARRLKPQLDGP